MFLRILVFVVISMPLLSQANLEFEGGNIYDWGQVKPDESPLKTIVKIQNTGNETLQIIKVKPSCGCTTAPINKDEIAPGEHAELDVTFDVKGANGTVNKYIQLQTNIEDRPYIHYYLNAFVERDIGFIGDNLFNYGSISKGENASKTVQIENRTGDDVRIEKIDMLEDYVYLNIEEGTIIPANSAIILKATVNSLITGPFTFNILIRTENSEDYNLNITGWGTVMQCSN